MYAYIYIWLLIFTSAWFGMLCPNNSPFLRISSIRPIPAMWGPPQLLFLFIYPEPYRSAMVPTNPSEHWGGPTLVCKHYLGKHRYQPQIRITLAASQVTWLSCPTFLWSPVSWIMIATHRASFQKSERSISWLSIKKLSRSYKEIIFFKTGSTRKVVSM